MEVARKDLGMSDDKCDTQQEPDASNKKEEVESLSPDKAVTYRSCVARLTYLAQDRPDIQFPARVVYFHVKHHPSCVGEPHTPSHVPQWGNVSRIHNRA